LTNLNCCRPDEVRSAVECRNAALRETLFAIGGNIFDQGALELHQPRPLYSNLSRTNPVSLHAPPNPVDNLSGAY
jgi:hypothetical protein